MREYELLGAKTVTAARPSKVSLSIGAQASGYSWRVRAAFTTEDFNYLFEKLGSAVAPRANMMGTASLGLVVQLTKNGGNALNSQKSTVNVSVAARSLEIVENKVPQTAISAFIVEFDDGTRALVTEPLPRSFMATSTWDKIKNRERHFLTVYEKAFELVHGVKPGVVDQARPAEEQKPTLSVPEATVAEIAPPVAAIKTETAGVQMPPIVSDLKDMIALVNDLVEQSKTQPGNNIVLRIEDGALRASVEVVYKQDL